MLRGMPGSWSLLWVALYSPPINSYVEVLPRPAVGGGVYKEGRGPDPITLIFLQEEGFVRHHMQRTTRCGLSEARAQEKPAHWHLRLSLP